MPWTVDNPPPPAENWNKAEKEKCVIAANATLARGGDEEEAVFACISAAGRSESESDSTSKPIMNQIGGIPREVVHHKFSINDSVALPGGGVGKIRALKNQDDISFATVQLFKDERHGFIADDECKPVTIDTNSLTAVEPLKPPKANFEPIVNVKAAKSAEIILYADIVDDDWMGGITASSVVNLLNEFKDFKTLDIRINSPGGDVTSGFTIYNRLRSHSAFKRVYIDGVAASIASVIAMAGDEIIMGEPSLIMIHNAWMGFVSGNAEELEKQAKALRAIDKQINSVYQARTGLEEETILEMMNEETWLTEQEALAINFVDKIEKQEERAAAKIYPQSLKKPWLKNAPKLS